MTAACPICRAVATEIAATDQQAVYRGGCRHIEIVRVHGKIVVQFQAKDKK